MRKIIGVIAFVLSQYAMGTVSSVKFKSFDNQELNAKLYKPQNQTESSGILIIEGSGKSGFLEEPSSSPFAQLAIALASSGHTVLTFNKRGSGENHDNGSFWKATFSSDNADALSALNFLQTQLLGAEQKIYLVGHSFGGPHSLKIASENPLVNGVILLSSTIRPVEELQIEQTGMILRLSGIGEAAIQTEQNSLRQMISEIRKGSFECSPPVCEIHDETQVVDGLQVPWWKEVLNLDLAAVAAEIMQPILFISGGADPIIPDSDFAFAKEKFESLRSRTMLRIEKMDHLMTLHDSKVDSLSYMREVQKTKVFDPIAAELPQKIQTWIESL